jgi:hypothetical protein
VTKEQKGSVATDAVLHLKILFKCSLVAYDKNAESAQVGSLCHSVHQPEKMIGEQNVADRIVARSACNFTPAQGDNNWCAIWYSHVP